MILVYAESNNKKFKKSSYEAISYGKKLSELINSDFTVITIGKNLDHSILKEYGANDIVHVPIDPKDNYDDEFYSNIISDYFNKKNFDIIIVSNTNHGKSITPSISLTTNCSLITNVVELPSSIEPFIIKKKVFSNKAYANYEISNKKKIISISPNSFGIKEIKSNSNTEFIELSSDIDYTSKLNSISINKNSDKISLPEADLVVSAGRGLKGPENWKMIEELSQVLGAATACSKPVSDIGWRPHSEHVGQTGISINPELYIAIGISGAIQHLAGVSSSKNIVVINTDKDAPFFKAADYGIVGDAFDVIPKLISEIKKFKSDN